MSEVWFRRFGIAGAMIIFILFGALICRVVHGADLYSEQRLHAQYAQCNGSHIRNPNVRHRYCVSCCARGSDAWTSDDYRPRGSFDRCLARCNGGRYGRDENMPHMQGSQVGSTGSQEHRQDRPLRDVQWDRHRSEVDGLYPAIIEAGTLINSNAPPAVPLAAVVVPIASDETDPAWQDFQAEDNGRAAERESGRGRPEGIYDDIRQDEYDRNMNWRLRRSDDDNRRERELNERGRRDD